MKKIAGYNFLTFFSPLDLVTVFYALLSGFYMCFSTASFTLLVPHFVTRALILILIVCLSGLAHKFQTNKLVLFLRNLYPLLFLGFFYTETSCLKNIIFSENLDLYFFNAEQSLWNCQPSIEFSRVMGQGWFNELMNLCYFSYYLLISVVCIVLYLKKQSLSQKSIFVVILSFYLYYIIFAILPVVGPQYYLTNLPDTTPPYFFGKLMHHIIVNLEQPTGAFPSSHVGIAIIIAYVAYKHLKKIFFIILPFVVGICFATVYVKAHYVIDVIAGLISAPLFIILSEKIYNKFLSCNSKKMAN